MDGDSLEPAAPERKKLSPAVFDLMSDADIAHDASVEPAKVAELREIVHLTAHMRAPSQWPDLGA
jgi:hypothetical protein